MIEIENLQKRFGKNQVLKGLNLEITNPGVFAVLGPNGSGKTTLIKCILGMVLPNSGKIKVNGVSVKNNWEYRKSIDYLPQIANFPGNLTVLELFKMIKDLRGKKDLNETALINKFALEPHLSKKLGNLSGGTKQKVNLVLTFLFDSPILILDEPTTGLDPIALVTLRALIEEARAKGKIILVTSHIMNFVEEISDEIVFLLEGKIYFKGTVNEMKESTQQHDLEHAIAQLLRTAQHD